MKLDKGFFLRFLFLMILSLKVSFVVYQNISIISNATDISFVLDIDESEKEEKNEKKELEESEKIHKELDLFDFSSFASTSVFTAVFKLNYKTLHLEFTTPPPEIV